MLRFRVLRQPALSRRGHSSHARLPDRHEALESPAEALQGRSQTLLNGAEQTMYSTRRRIHVVDLTEVPKMRHPNAAFANDFSSLWSDRRMNSSKFSSQRTNFRLSMNRKHQHKKRHFYSLTTEVETFKLNEVI